MAASQMLSKKMLLRKAAEEDRDLAECVGEMGDYFGHELGEHSGSSGQAKGESRILVMNFLYLRGLAILK